MQELVSLIVRAQARDLDAYGEVVRRFQQMAYGYAYAILGDFHLAEDAAQEAFLEAYRDLPKLREPAAFAGYLRRIVSRRCSRLLLGNPISTVPLDAASRQAAQEAGPEAVAWEQEVRDAVLRAVRSLPADEREVTSLFYINGYSHSEIAEFLEVPVGTVKTRLHTSRKRLKERIFDMATNEIKTHRLSERFPEDVRLTLETRRPYGTSESYILVFLAAAMLLGRYAEYASAQVLSTNSFAPSIATGGKRTGALAHVRPGGGL